MRAVVIIKSHIKGGEISKMLFAHLGDQVFWTNAQAIGFEHDGRAVSVIGTDKVALVAALFLKAYPNIGLDVFDQMAEMDGAIGIRQGAGNEYLSVGHNSDYWQ